MQVVSDKRKLNDDGASKETEATNKNGNSASTSGMRAGQCSQTDRLLLGLWEEHIARQKELHSDTVSKG